MQGPDPDRPRDPLARIETARHELGRTAVSPAVARGLVAGLLALTTAPLLAQLAVEPAFFLTALRGVAGDAASAPGASVAGRVLAGNRALLASMRAIDDRLSDESLATRIVRPPLQALLQVAGADGSPAGDGTIVDSRLRYRGDPAFPEHDSRGFRNRDALERADVVLLGDSMTYGLRVPANRNWARVLTEETGLVSYNMATPGWGPLQARFVLPDALALKPKVILHGFFLGNDFLDALDMHTRWLPLAPATRPRPPCHEYFPQANGVRGFFSRPGRAAERNPNDTVTFFDGMHWSGTLRAPWRFCAVDDSDPRIRKGVAIATSTLLAMAQDVNDSSTTFAVVLLPTKESVFAPRIANPENHKNLAELVATESRLRGELAGVLRANDIPVLDLLPPLRDAPEQPYSITGAHPNVAGSHVIGLAAAQFVLGIVPTAPASSRAIG